MRKLLPELLVVGLLVGLFGALFGGPLAGPVALAASDDPLVDQQWHLPAVNTFDAWRAGRGAGVVVAVVDTGVDATHPDLAGRVGQGVDLVDRGTPPHDENGHGTLVAGVVAANADNGIGVAGVAPQVTIMPVRVLDDEGAGNTSTVAEGIRWATRNGADVINLSLAEAPGLLRGISGLLGSEVEAAIREADEAGVLVVAAAGNEGLSTTPYGSSVPLLVVGATTRDGSVWGSSNRDSRTLFAPGVEILSTYLDHGYARDDGTSFSTPIVSAGAAILRGLGLTAAEAAQRLRVTAAPVGAGVGLVDLAAAAGVEVTDSDPPPPPPAQPTPPSTEPPPPTDTEAGAGSGTAPAPRPESGSVTVAEPTQEPAPPQAAEPEPALAAPSRPGPVVVDDRGSVESPAEPREPVGAEPPPRSEATGGEQGLALLLLVANLAGLAVARRRGLMS